MKRNKHRNSVESQRIGKVEHDDCKKADLQEFEASSEHYERRSRIQFKWRQGDWWIAIGLYLALVSVAFVVL